ncbi:hypothetical protein CHS0354_033527 [Potamilus streckersoni]|uniref:Uncharacterized protein n=1 Tax=Potamilus streckersoni TaxID=2493646 RepID=A0AAE0S6W5_9BIVA|nr:hypothetical protein CHS0354_033527 [Potamilus streckersoni]
MNSFTCFSSVFVIASIVSVNCFSAEETNAILREVQKDILNLSADMVNIKRKMIQDRQDRDQLILKLNQTISLYNGIYNKAESIPNYTLDISRIHLDSIRALERGLKVEKKFRYGSMIELRNLYQENHDLKLELKSLTENIKNQSDQFKELQDELKESKTQSRQLKNLQDKLTDLKNSERDFRTTLMQAITHQNQVLKKQQDEQKENRNQSQQLKELHDKLTELKASENDK